MLTLTEHSRLPVADVPSIPGLETEWSDGRFVLRAGGEIGLFPGRVGQTPVLAVVYPKGLRDSTDPAEQMAALRRFFQLWMLAQGASPATAQDSAQWATQRTLTPQQMFPYLLAVAYSRVLRDLCERDLRRAYLQHEEVLSGRVRGRLDRQRHLSLVLRGRGHMIPCSWEEFTADGWDNRILKAAMLRLLRQGAREGLSMHRMFAFAQGALQEVSEVPVGRETFTRARLHRLSSRYRTALSLAEAILLGGEPSTGNNLRGECAGPHGQHTLRISTHDTFERFCRRIVGDAARPMGLIGHQKPDLRPLLSSSRHAIQPDLAVQAGGHILALGDAKYKQVVRALVDAPMSSEGMERIRALALQTSDQYQLFSYMRLERCPIGFFMVPFWDAAHEAVAHCTEHFRCSPLDDAAPHTVRIVALNLMHSPAAVMTQASALLQGWLAERVQAPAAK